MSFFSKVGRTFKRTFANPTKLVADISTGGLTAIARTLPKKIGGGQSGVFSKASEVMGAGAIGGGSGIVTGFATGGPVGAIYGGILGAAAGTGRGISGAIHNESGRTIAAGSSKWGGLSGIVGGGVARVSSYVAANSAAAAKSAAAKAAVEAATKPAGVFASSAATTAAAGSAGSGVLSSLGSVALLSLLQRPSGMPGSSGGADVSVSNPGGGPMVETPASGPWQYPAVSGGGEIAGTPAMMASNTNFLFIGLAALVALFFILKKKKVF